MYGKLRGETEDTTGDGGVSVAEGGQGEEESEVGAEQWTEIPRGVAGVVEHTQSEYDTFAHSSEKEAQRDHRRCKLEAED